MKDFSPCPHTLSPLPPIRRYLISDFALAVPMTSPLPTLQEQLFAPPLLIHEKDKAHVRTHPSLEGRGGHLLDKDSSSLHCHRCHALEDSDLRWER